VAGQVVCATLTSLPLKDNLTKAQVLVYTHPRPSAAGPRVEDAASPRGACGGTRTDRHRLLQSRYPVVHEVVTFNAEVNDHMIAVNELLGYRPTARSAEFHKTVS
jgi:hypothetical protein